MRFRKKPIEVEAVQWTGENREEIEALIGFPMPKLNPGVQAGEWLVRHGDGTIHSFLASSFNATYEPASAPQPALDEGDQERLIEAINIGELLVDALEWLEDQRPKATVTDAGERVAERYKSRLASLRSLASRQPNSEAREHSELAGIASGECPHCGGGMDAFGGVHLKDCPLADGEVSAQPTPTHRYTMEEIREALRLDHWIAHHRKEEREAYRNCANPEGGNEHKAVREAFEDVQRDLAAFNKATDESGEGEG